MRALQAIVMALMLAITSSTAFAVSPSEMLPDPALEARARTISEGLRCLVCQNQSIDDSDADLAHDLRVLVRERLTAGDSDTQVLDYIVARYGEFVLLKPAVAPHTIVLWIAAPTLLLGGLIAVFIGNRRRRGVEQSELTEDEAAALKSLED
jgi:cytochrome c-type biogenesis protein CcmH